MAIIIRDAVPGDESVVVDLVQELAFAVDWPSPADEHSVRHFLADPDTGILLDEDEGAVVGLRAWSVAPDLFHAADSGMVQALVVTEGRRGEGIGRRLLEAGIRRLRAAGCLEIAIGVGPDDDRAQRLYMDCGFTHASLLLEQHFPGVAGTPDHEGPSARHPEGT